MLTALREGAKNSLIMKIIVFGFIGLGVGGLVFADVQGYFRDGGMSSGVVISVNYQEVGLQEFDQRLRRVINEQQVPQEIAYRFGVPVQVARIIGNELMVQAYANKKGLIADGDMVAEQLRRYIDPNRTEGESAENTLRRVAASVGVGPNRFIEVIESQVTRGMALDSYEGVAGIMPAELLSAFEKVSNQTRSIETVFLNYADQPVKGEETEEVLQAHYEGIKTRDFAIPEEKTVRFAILDMQARLDAAPEPDDEEITAYYKDNADRFMKPGRVVMTQAVFDTAEDAQAAFDAMQSGKTLESVSGDNLRPEGEFTADGLPPALSEAVFGGNDTMIAPVETAFGHHIARIDQRLAAEPVPLDDIRDDIANEIKSVGVEEAFFSKLDRLEDMAMQGATLDNLASQFELDVQVLENVQPDQSNRLSLNEEDEDATTIFPRVYNQTADQVGDLIPLSDTRYLIAETTISKERSFQPFEQVRAQVRTDWQANRRQQSARDRASEIVFAGQPLSETGEETRVFDALKNEGMPPAPLTEQALAQIFNTSPDSGPQQVMLEDGILLFEITNVAFDAAAEEDSIVDTLTDAQSAMILEGLQTYLQETIAVKINENLIGRVYAAEEGTGGTPFSF